MNELGQHVPRTQAENIDALIEGMHERDVRFVIPTRDGELLFFAEHAERFRRAGISVMISSPPAVATCLDKLAFAERCVELQLPAIPTALTPTELPGLGPYVVKERFGAGSRSIGLGLCRRDAEAWARTLEHPIFQPHILGAEFSVDVFRSSRLGRAIAVARSRDLVVDGESQVSTIQHDLDLEVLACRVADGLNIVGHAVVQAIRADDELHLIECNPRVGGASTLSFAAGLHSIRWFIEDATGVLRGSDFTGITPAQLHLVRTAEDHFE